MDRGRSRRSRRRHGQPGRKRSLLAEPRCSTSATTGDAPPEGLNSRRERHSRRIAMTTSIPESDAQRLVARSAARPAKKGSRRMRRVLALDAREWLPRRHLPRPIFGYISGAAETNASLNASRAAYQDYAFLPRVLV